MAFTNITSRVRHLLDWSDTTSNHTDDLELGLIEQTSSSNDTIHTADSRSAEDRESNESAAANEQGKGSLISRLFLAALAGGALMRGATILHDAPKLGTGEALLFPKSSFVPPSHSSQAAQKCEQRLQTLRAAGGDFINAYTAVKAAPHCSDEEKNKAFETAEALARTLGATESLRHSDCLYDRGIQADLASETIRDFAEPPNPIDSGFEITADTDIAGIAEARNNLKAVLSAFPAVLTEIQTEYRRAAQASSFSPQLSDQFDDQITNLNQAKKYVESVIRGLSTRTETKVPESMVNCGARTSLLD